MITLVEPIMTTACARSWWVQHGWKTLYSLRFEVVDSTIEEVIEWVFDVFRRFPSLIRLRVEKEAHAKGTFAVYEEGNGSETEVSKHRPSAKEQSAVEEG